MTLDLDPTASVPVRPGATARRRIWRVQLEALPHPVPAAEASAEAPALATTQIAGQARRQTRRALSPTQAPEHAFNGLSAHTAVQLRAREDTLAVEEPLEIRLRTPDAVSRAISITMRTPGHDFELAAGFLFTEGIIGEANQIQQMEYCVGPVAEQQYNVVSVRLRPGVTFDPGVLQRHFYTTSSCGVCGKTSLEALRTQVPWPAPVPGDGPQVVPHVVAVLPDRLREVQGIFDRTGGLHAAGLFAADGELVSVREDVGRHNALDKLIGEQLLARRLPASQSLLVVSGRASFELVQKAAMAGVPFMVAVGAPSSLSVEAAIEFGITLVGFARGLTFNIYSHPERVSC